MFLNLYNAHLFSITLLTIIKNIFNMLFYLDIFTLFSFYYNNNNNNNNNIIYLFRN